MKMPERVFSLAKRERNTAHRWIHHRWDALLCSARLLHCVQVPRSRQKFVSLSPQAKAIKLTRNDLVPLSLSVRTIHLSIPTFPYTFPNRSSYTRSLSSLFLVALFDILFMSHFRYFDVLYFMLQFINFSHGHLHKLVIETNESEQKR